MTKEKLQEIMEKSKKGSEENKKPEKNEEEKKGENWSQIKKEGAEIWKLKMVIHLFLFILNY